MAKKKVFMVSLGCPKNQVDAEMLLGRIDSGLNYEVTTDLEQADVAMINTCGFIDDAKKESIEAVLDMCQLKEAGNLQKVVVTGCLAERYRDEIVNEIPQVDAVVGIGSNSEILQSLDKIFEGENVLTFGDKLDLPLSDKRILTTPNCYSYLKVADGCDNCCTYCAIPLIRGSFRSRPKEEVLKEAEELVQMGVKEIMVVAQDTTRYGEDLYGKLVLPELLRELCKIDGLEWVRVMYCYPERITDELLDVMGEEEKIVKYLELPIQHVNGEILKTMNRRGNYEQMGKLIDKIRQKVPDIAIRTTLITGFPGETEAQFEELHRFIKEKKFDRLGCFAYSKEEDTPAYRMDNQIDQETKMKRCELILNDQMMITEDINMSRVGSLQTVLVESYLEEAGQYLARSQFDAPDIDGIVYITATKPLTIGSLVQVKIEDADQYDLFAVSV